MCVASIFSLDHTLTYIASPYGVSSGLICSTDQSAMSLPSLWVHAKSCCPIDQCYICLPYDCTGKEELKLSCLNPLGLLLPKF